MAKALGDLNRLLSEVKKSNTETKMTVEGKSGIKVSIEFKRRFDKFGIELATVAKNALIEIGEEILEESVNTAPVETGKLVESATLYIEKTPISRGKVVSIDHEAKIAITTIERLTNASNIDLANRKYFNIYISYTRSTSDKPNLALWLHENVQEFGMGSPSARMQDRGGKFLEQPFHNNLDTVLNRIKSRVKQAKNTLNKNI